MSSGVAGYLQNCLQPLHPSHGSCRGGLQPNIGFTYFKADNTGIRLVKLWVKKQGQPGMEWDQVAFEISLGRALGDTDPIPGLKLQVQLYLC